MAGLPRQLGTVDRFAFTIYADGVRLMLETGRILPARRGTIGGAGVLSVHLHCIGFAPAPVETLFLGIGNRQDT